MKLASPPHHDSRGAAPRLNHRRVVSSGPRTAAPPADAALHPVVQARLKVSPATSVGQPLPADLNAEFSDQFAHDFSPVRIHADPRAARAARAFRARAFTAGHHIYFSAGRFAPASVEGRHLLAHELAHVAQQSTDAGGSVAPGARQEREAGRAAAEAGAGEPFVNIGEHSAPGVARVPESLSTSLPAQAMSDEEIREELKEIHLWMAGQIATNEDTLILEAAQQELQAELIRRHREKAKAEAQKKKPARGKRKARSAAPTPTISEPTPRSAVSSFDPEQLSAEEKAEELQQIEEWEAITPREDWRKKEVARSRQDLTGSLARQESAPLMESHSVVLARVVGSRLKYETRKGLNRFEVIKELQHHLYVGGLEAEQAIAAIDLIYKQRNEMRIRSAISETLGGADDPEPLLDQWSKARDLLRAAEAALDKGNYVDAAWRVNESMAASNSAVRGVQRYFGDVVSGADRAITGLEVTKTVAAATVTIGTGGAAGVVVGGGYAGVQNLAQQASEIHYGLRDKIDWGGVAFDTVVGGLSGYLGGKLGNKVLVKLLGNPATASFGRKALSIAVSDYIAGRAGSTIHLTARTAFDVARGQDITWEQYLDRLADQITDPKQAAIDLIMGHASRRVTAARATETPPPTTTPTRTTPITPADAATAYANRFNGRLVNDAGLEGLFTRTREQSTLSVDRRAASVELRTVNDVLTNGYNGRPVAQVRVLPPTSTQRTPDLALTFGDGTTTRIEIRTFSFRAARALTPKRPARHRHQHTRDAAHANADRRCHSQQSGDIAHAPQPTGRPGRRGLRGRKNLD